MGQSDIGGLDDIFQSKGAAFARQAMFGMTWISHDLD